MKSLLRVFKGEAVIPPPIWLMRQAGRHLTEYRNLRAEVKNFLSFCYSPDLAVEATLQPIHRYGFDAAILFSDILVIPDALGQEVSFVEGIGPRLNPIETVKDIENLSTTNLHKTLLPIYETITRLTNKLPSETALIGFAGAPWTVATYMIEGGSSRDFRKIKSWTYNEPEKLQLLIDCLIDATSSYLSLQADQGVEVLQIFDSWAGVLPARQFEKWVVEPFQKIVAIVKDKHPQVPIIGFPRGAGLQYINFATETGVDAVGIDSTVPISWAAKNIQPHCVVQGNLDNLALLAGGIQMKEEVVEILECLGHGPFIFNLGHGILPETPVTHVQDLVALVRSG